MLSKLKEQWSQLLEKLSQQAWYQEARGKWEELDATLRFRIQIGSMIGGTLLLIGLALNSLWSVHQIKNEIAEKNALAQQISGALDEINRLRSERSSGGFDVGSDAPWNTFFEAAAQRAEMDSSVYQVGAEQRLAGEAKPVDKTAQKGKGASPAPSPTLKESLFEITLKKSNLRQVLRFAFEIENGSRPTKIRSLMIDTKQDPEGYLDATLKVSAFQLSKPE